MKTLMRRRGIPILFILLATAALVGIFFGHLIFSPNLYYSGDAARGYLAQRLALADALSSGQFPWWETDLGIGYPLLAEGEAAALYPVNWMILAIFPADISLNVSLIFHVILAGIGMYLWLRRQGLPNIVAYGGGIVLPLGGFYVAHQNHLSILTVAAWLPWLLYLSDIVLQPSMDSFKAHAMGFISLAGVVALQFTGGHAQISLLNLMLVAMYALYCMCLVRHRTTVPAAPTTKLLHRRLGRIVAWTGALVVGCLVASPQLAASWQLSQLSNRAGGLESSFFTSFSFHPLLIATYVTPFIRGNPYPNGSVELSSYLGLLPICLAALGIWSSPRGLKWFLLTIIILGFLMAFGRWNPIYPYLLRIPVINLFRVPARFLLWTSVGLVGLSALGLEVLLSKRIRPIGRWRWLSAGAIIIGTAVLAVLVISGTSADQLVSLWRWLPLGFGTMIILLWASIYYLPRWVWTCLAGMLLVLDLYAYGAVLYHTYNTVAPISQVRQPPVVLEFLQQDHSLYRLYTKEEILPITSVQKESFYPNYGASYGVASANLYMPLIPAEYLLYMQGLTAKRLDALNVKYYLIPQLLPVDEASELYDVFNPYSSFPYSRWLEFSPIAISEIKLESYLSHSAGLQQGDLAAELILRGEAGDVISLPIRAGIESAEWAYERPDVAQVIAYDMAPVASTFPARSGFPAVDHPGHTYLASWVLRAPMTITAIYIQPTLPEAYIRIEQVQLLDEARQGVLLNHLVGLGNHHLAYRSEDVLVYRNDDVRPRAYTVNITETERTGNEITLPANPSSLLPARILEYSPQKVRLHVALSEPGYLVLADLFYPGWQVTVDGRLADPLCADSVYRAVMLDSGEHLIEFNYQFNWFGD